MRDFNGESLLHVSVVSSSVFLFSVLRLLEATAFASWLEPTACLPWRVRPTS